MPETKEKLRLCSMCQRRYGPLREPLNAPVCDGCAEGRTIGRFGLAPSGEPLSEEEVAELPDDTHVLIIWGEDNGPHRYYVVRKGEQVGVTPTNYEEAAERLWLPIPSDISGPLGSHVRVWPG